MKAPFEARWAGRSARPFAEAAEVLDVATDQIMAALEHGPFLHVIFTPDREKLADPDALRGVALRRGQDGVLHQVTQPEPVPELADALRDLREE